VHGLGQADIFVQADLVTAPARHQTLGTLETLGAYVPSAAALNGTIPTQGILSILLSPNGSSPSFVPPMEVVIVNRAGQGLLVYLPQIPMAPLAGIRVLVADDGSTYFAPADSDTVTQAAVLQQNSFAGLTLARAAQGQVLPMLG